MGGLIVVVCVAKRVFGDRYGVWRHFRIGSPAEALSWRQVAHCVVLLSLCRDWRATAIGALGNLSRARSIDLNLFHLVVFMAFRQSVAGNAMAARALPPRLRSQQGLRPTQAIRLVLHHDAWSPDAVPN